MASRTNGTGRRNSNALGTPSKPHDVWFEKFYLGWYPVNLKGFGFTVAAGAVMALTILSMRLGGAVSLAAVVALLVEYALILEFVKSRTR